MKTNRRKSKIWMAMAPLAICTALAHADQSTDVIASENLRTKSPFLVDSVQAETFLLFGVMPAIRLTVQGSSGCNPDYLVENSPPREQPAVSFYNLGFNRISAQPGCFKTLQYEWQPRKFDNDGKRLTKVSILVKNQKRNSQLGTGNETRAGSFKVEATVDNSGEQTQYLDLQTTFIPDEVIK